MDIISDSISRRGFLGLALAPALSGAVDDVRRQFADVPANRRMIMHWYIFGPAWNAAEARRQLELMHQAHLGGVLIFPTYPIALDNPAAGVRNLPYLSAEYLEVLRSAVADANRLGMIADTVIGTGWPYGGPSVKLDESVRSLRRAAVRPNAEKLPGNGPGEQQIATFDNSGALLHSVPPGYQGELQVFYSAPTRMQVKRAAVGGEGWIIDHYDPRVVTAYLNEVGNKLLDGIQKGLIRAIFCDSLEVYRATWTPEFPGIFRRRRGYDLIPFLPALWNSAEPDSRDVRCDFWRTLSEQAVDAFLKPLQAWAHQHGVLAEVEAYGTPPVSLAGYRYVDIPTGEHYEWKEFNSSRWASSGGHLAGKPVILAEAWTWLGLPNRFGDSLEELKLCSDLHFLSGINALYGVTYAYSPEDLGSPGWPPYFGPVTNHTAPYWPHFRHFADYVNRASFVLQQGKPVADIALYLPAEDCMAEAGTEQLLLNWATRDRISSNGAPPEFRLRNALHYESDVVKTMITNGYAFDGLDTFTMKSGMRVEQGRLRMGDGDYSIIVLPNLTAIDVDSLQKIAAFVREGGTAIATRRAPGTAYGMRDRDRNRERVRSLVVELFGVLEPDRALTVNRYGRGAAIFSRDERASFLKALTEHQQPDIHFAEPSEHVSFAHRRTPERDFYFVVNTSETPQHLDATFRVGNKQPEAWDLMSGAVRAVPVYQHTSAGTRMPLWLGPREASVIAFSNIGAPEGVRTNLPPHGRVSVNGRYFIEKRGVPSDIDVSGIPAPTILSSEWRLSFSDPSLPPVMLRALRSWTELPGARFFSGQGTYETEFDLVPPPALRVLLDLGRVCETAGVFVNGAAAGVAWMRPYEIDITDHIRYGRNHLRLEVTNLLINKVLGMGPIDYSAVYAKYGQRFPPGDEWDTVREPFISGLLGPVRLVFYKSIAVD